MDARRWDERYAGEAFAFGDQPNDFLAALAPRIPPGPVLCLGDGEGRNGVFLAGLGHAVTSVDQSRVGLAKAAMLASRHGVALTTVVADLNDFDLGEAAWSGIVSIFCHMPPDERRALHARVRRALRPGGVFLLEAYRPEQIVLGTGGPRQPELLMTLAGLKRELAGLDFVVAEAPRRELREGAHHCGPSAVVQILAVNPA